MGRNLLSTLVLILAMNRGQPLTLDILLNNEIQGSKERDHCDLSQVKCPICKGFYQNGHYL
jgi:hypothetical protein